MIHLEDLEILCAFAKYGSLSKASEHLLISQPTMSRAMNRLENEMNIPLLEREKNHLLLNENGKLTVELASHLLNEANELVTRVQAADQSRHTIAIGSVSPAPLWSLVPECNELFPSTMISSEMKPEKDLLQEFQKGLLDAIVLNRKINDDHLVSVKYITERLMLSIPKDHELANKRSVTFAELNGMTMLVYGGIGQWSNVHKKNMPDSRFLIQNDRASFLEIIASSDLPSFSTNLSMRKDGLDHKRKAIPITDRDAEMTFWLCLKKDQEKGLSKLLEKYNSQKS